LILLGNGLVRDIDFVSVAKRLGNDPGRDRPLWWGTEQAGASASHPAGEQLPNPCIPDAAKASVGLRVTAGPSEREPQLTWTLMVYRFRNKWLLPAFVAASTRPLRDTTRAKCPRFKPGLARETVAFPIFHTLNNCIAGIGAAGLVRINCGPRADVRTSPIVRGFPRR
jgi:hypothetical protein